MQNILVNDDFGKSIKRLRSILPVLSFSLLIITYLISAAIMGIFHAQNAPNWGFTIAAFLVPLAIQAGRGTLVFFFQLNPAHIQGRISFGIIAATVLLILSLIETCLVMTPYGLSWIISVCTLMAIGWIVEIMILREAIFATQVELFQNQDRWDEIKSFYLARNDMKYFIEELKRKRTPPNSSTTMLADKPHAFSQSPSQENKTILLLDELKELLEGNFIGPSLKNRQAKGSK